MSASEPRRGLAYVGVSEGTEDAPAKLEDAIHDAATQAANDGNADETFKLVHIEFTAHNPHITAYKVIVASGGGA
jgi:hypothetical protein